MVQFVGSNHGAGGWWDHVRWSQGGGSIGPGDSRASGRTQIQCEPGGRGAAPVFGIARGQDGVRAVAQDKIKGHGVEAVPALAASGWGSLVAEPSSGS